MLNKFLIILLLLTSEAGAQTSALAVSDSLYSVGNNSKAIEILKEIDPASEEVNLRLAKIYQAQGELNKAEEYYRIILKKNSEKILTALDLGKILLKQQNLKEADSIFRDLTLRYPENPEFQYQLGVVMEEGEDSTAIDQYKKVVQLESTQQNALFKLAKNELMNSQYSMAINYSLPGLERNPSNISLLSIIAQAYYGHKSYKKAASEFEKLVLLGQGNEFIHSRLGFSYSQISEYEKAISHYLKALEFENRNSDTHYNLGKLYALTGDLKKSESHLLIAVTIKDQPLDAEYLSLGLTYKLQEEYQKALEFLNKSLEENPENERALYERAVAADNYFEDLQTKIDYYRAYLNKFEKTGNRDIIYLAKTRMTDLREEFHLKN